MKGSTNLNNKQGNRHLLYLIFLYVTNPYYLQITVPKQSRLGKETVAELMDLHTVS